MAGIDINQFKQKQVTPASTAQKQHVSGVFEFLNRDISIFAIMGDKQKEAFYHELSILLKAGIDLKSALELLVAQLQKPREARLLEQIKDNIIIGGSLSASMQLHHDFTPYEYYSVQIGEETGKLADVLEELAIFYRKRLKQKRQITGALMYPAIVTLTSLGAVFFMMNFIVPMFGDIFRRSGGSLPAITQFIVDVSDFTRSYAHLFLLGVVAIGVWMYLQRRKEWLRKAAATVMLKLPIFGTMIRKIYLARFCNSMALLTGSKVPLIRAIQLSRQMVGFYPIEISLDIIEKDILQGQSLHSSLTRFAIYDIKMVSLIKVGEEVNQLTDFFGKVAAQYGEDIEHQSAMISSLMEPFIIIFLGIFVGIILIAMYLPLFQMGGSFG